MQIKHEHNLLEISSIYWQSSPNKNPLYPHRNPVFTRLHAGHSHWPAATRHPHIRGDPGLWARARSEIACMKWYGTNKEHCIRSEKRRAITHHIERDEKWRVWLYWQNRTRRKRTSGGQAVSESLGPLSDITLACVLETYQVADRSTHAEEHFAADESTQYIFQQLLLICTQYL